MPDDEFINEMISYGGIEDEYLDNPEILEFLVYILKNDFRIIETINSNGEFSTVKTDISVLNGYNDRKISQERVEKWNDYTEGNCTIKFYNGGHFYINSNLNEVCDYILQFCK